MVAPHLNYLRHVKHATVIPASAMPERLHRVLAENMATQSQHGRGALNLEGTLCPNPIFVCRVHLTTSVNNATCRMDAVKVPTSDPNTAHCKSSSGFRAEKMLMSGTAGST